MKFSVAIQAGSCFIRKIVDVLCCWLCAVVWHTTSGGYRRTGSQEFNDDQRLDHILLSIIPTQVAHTGRLSDLCNCTQKFHSLGPFTSQCASNGSNSRSNHLISCRFVCNQSISDVVS